MHGKLHFELDSDNSMELYECVSDFICQALYLQRKMKLKKFELGIYLFISPYLSIHVFKRWVAHHFLTLVNWQRGS